MSTNGREKEPNGLTLRNKSGRSFRQEANGSRMHRQGLQAGEEEEHHR